MPSLTGLDRLCQQEFSGLRGKSIGLVCNQATVNKEFRHVLDLLLPFHDAGKLSIEVVFGPQHGLFGHTQDNMIEWEGGPRIVGDSLSTRSMAKIALQMQNLSGLWTCL